MEATHLETWEGDLYSASIYNLPDSTQKTIWLKIGIAAVEIESAGLTEIIELLQYIQTRIQEIEKDEQ